MVDNIDLTSATMDRDSVIEAITRSLDPIKLHDFTQLLTSMNSLTVEGILFLARTRYNLEPSYRVVNDPPKFDSNVNTLISTEVKRELVMTGKYEILPPQTDPPKDKFDKPDARASKPRSKSRLSRDDCFIVYVVDHGPMTLETMASKCYCDVPGVKRILNWCRSNPKGLERYTITSMGNEIDVKSNPGWRDEFIVNLRNRGCEIDED